MLKGLYTIALVFCTFLYVTAQVDHNQVDFVQDALQNENISAKQIYITDHYTSQGITHTYFKEAINGIPIYNSRGAIHYKDKGAILVKTTFKRMAKDSNIPAIPSFSAKQSLEKVIQTKSLDMTGKIERTAEPRGVERSQTLVANAVSLRPIKSSLEYYIDNNGKIRLIWTLPIENIQTAWYTNYLIDAITGELVEEVDWTVECNHGSPNAEPHDCFHHAHVAIHANKESIVAAPVPNSYEVFAWPLESPNFGVRTTEVTPWNDNAVASPNGWHTIGGQSFTTTRGNNTDTYLDDDNTNSPTNGDAARADGGATLDFSFPLDVNQNPVDYQEAAVTNTFYWTNLMHDVWFNYGFDEASGNFQEENYTPNGNGSDYVRSEAQDGSGTCNANFGTPPDGSNPRMQMYLCGNRDGDYDNGVIAHEYGHGISNRLTGGPAASGCLGNQEQMGEGWSDYMGIVMTIEAGDAGTDSRGMGTWLFGEGPDGDGIRPFPYSTDFNVNPMTYNTINTVSVPHGVGSVWCTMLWDMTWALIDEYGFDPDIYNGTGGNNIAMQLVMEGMKLQPCSPGFVSGRDAILEADELLYGGVNSCMIWNAFANRGLGFSADEGSTGNRSDGIEAFDLPPSCSLNIEKSTITTSANETEQIEYQIVVENNLPDETLIDILVTDTIPQELQFVSATDGGIESGGIISFPLFNLMNGESDTFDVVLEVKTGLTYTLSDIYDDVESGTANWSTAFSGSTNWSTQNTVSNSGMIAWFAPDNDSPGTAVLDLAFEVGVGDNSELSFFHQYDTEATWDGGQVFISTDQGARWNDLGASMTSNGYNSTVFNSIPGFSGNSNGFVNTIIELSSYAGQNVLIRFQMNCDQSVGGNGWWIDDVVFTNLRLLTINKAAVQSGAYNVEIYSNAVELVPEASIFQVEAIATNGTCAEGNGGSIQLSPQGGSGSYTYLWNDGETTQNRSNLSAGIYRVTVSDGVDQIQKVRIISELETIDLDLIVEDITNATGDNGSIEVIATGGSGGYSYLWEGGETTTSISNLTEGLYKITVTDTAGCMESDSAEVLKFSCGDTYYDSGGPSSNYSNNEDRSIVICPDDPDDGIVLTFNSMNIESTWDALYVHDGNSTASPIFDSGNPATQAGFPAGGYYGTAVPGPFQSTNETGCLTLRFRSDQFVTRSGWDIDITCGPKCAKEVLNLNADGYGSLKRQILCADPLDVIEIHPDVYNESINLDATLVIDKQLTIDPGSGNSFSIVSNEQGPIFTIAANGSLELNHITLISGESDPAGALLNDGTLILNNVNIFENENTSGPTGLIQNNGQLVIRGVSNLLKE